MWSNCRRTRMWRLKVAIDRRCFIIAPVLLMNYEATQCDTSIARRIRNQNRDFFFLVLHNQLVSCTQYPIFIQYMNNPITLARTLQRSLKAVTAQNRCSCSLSISSHHSSNRERKKETPQTPASSHISYNPTTPLHRSNKPSNSSSSS